MYQDGSYAGPPDYIGRGLAERVHRLVESGSHAEYNRLVVAGVDGELAFLRCLHSDWAALVGSEVASHALLLTRQGSDKKMQA